MEPKEPIQNEINNEIVENIYSNMRKAWIEQGHKETVVIEDSPPFENPFQMMGYLKSLDESQEMSIALDRFEDSLIDDRRAEKYWATRDGRNRLIYYTSEPENPRAAKIARNIMNCMVRESRKVGADRRSFERIYSMELAVSRYFTECAYQQLEYWANEDNARLLYRYCQIPRKSPLRDSGAEQKIYLPGKLQSDRSPIAILEAQYEGPQGVKLYKEKEEEVDDPNDKHFESLRAYFDLLAIPGFLDQDYDLFRKEIVKRIKNPNEAHWNWMRTPIFVSKEYDERKSEFERRRKNPTVPEILQDEFERERRKYPFMDMLNLLIALSRNENSIYKEVSKRFISNMILDPELAILAEQLRRFEIDKREKEKKKSNEWRDKHKYGLGYEDVLEGIFDSENATNFEWYKRIGFSNLGYLFGTYPYLYMDVAKQYLKHYIAMKGNDQKREDLGKILRVMFPGGENGSLTPLFRDYEGLGGRFDRIFSQLYNIYRRSKESSNSELKKKLSGTSKLGKKLDAVGTLEKKIKKQIIHLIDEGGLISKFLGKDFNQILLDENIEFFKTRRDWIDYWRKVSRDLSMSSLFQNDYELFNMFVDSLMQSAKHYTGDYNFFDSIRTIQEISKKMDELKASSVHTVKDDIEDEKGETERKMKINAERLCKKEVISLSTMYEKDDFQLGVMLLNKYLVEYGMFVEAFSDKFVVSYEQNDREGYTIFSENWSVEMIRAIDALGLEFEKDDNGYYIFKGSVEELHERLFGILSSPTLFEWAEDDRKNVNVKNSKLRTLFFLPSKVNITYGCADMGLMGMDANQLKSFNLKYLQWYIWSKLLTGDDGSLNTVISVWLSDKPALRDYASRQSDSIKDGFGRAWGSAIDYLKQAFDLERFNRMDVLQRFLLATNVEEITALMSKDIYQVAMLASSVALSIIEVAQETRARKDLSVAKNTVRKVSADGSMSLVLSRVKYEKVWDQLRKKGFVDKDGGLELFRHAWENLIQLRGNRGVRQTIRITDDGVEISNPGNNMFGTETKKTIKDGKPITEVTHKNSGGPDVVRLSWSDIRTANTKFDYTPLNDLMIDLGTNIASALGQKSRPDWVRDLEKNAAANIEIVLAGRNEPSCEFFAIEYPEEFWNLLKALSNLMEEEEGGKNHTDMLKILNER